MCALAALTEILELAAVADLVGLPIAKGEDGASVVNTIAGGVVEIAESFAHAAVARGKTGESALAAFGGITTQGCAW